MIYPCCVDVRILSIQCNCYFHKYNDAAKTIPLRILSAPRSNFSFSSLLPIAPEACKTLCLHIISVSKSNNIYGEVEQNKAFQTMSSSLLVEFALTCDNCRRTSSRRLKTRITVPSNSSVSSITCDERHERDILGDKQVHGGEHQTHIYQTGYLQFKQIVRF